MSLLDSRLNLFRPVESLFHHSHNQPQTQGATNLSTTPIPTPAPVQPAPPVTVIAPPAPVAAAPTTAAPVTVTVAHPSALDKFESILGIVGKLVATDAPIVLQLVPSQKVAIGFGIGEVAVELATEAVTLISALKAAPATTPAQ